MNDYILILLHHVDINMTKKKKNINKKYWIFSSNHKHKIICNIEFFKE